MGVSGHIPGESGWVGDDEVDHSSPTGV